MSKTILQEAMEDAKLLKETAIKNAQNVLVEAISPKIKQYVNRQLGESDLGGAMYEAEDEEPEFEMPDLEDEEGDEMPEEGLWMESDDNDDDDELSESDDKDDDDKEEVVEITEEDLRRAFSEIVGGAVNEVQVSANFGDVEDPTPKTAGGKQQTGIADEKSGEHQWKDEVPPDAEDWTVESLRRAYRKKLSEAIKVIKSLQVENREYKKATTFLRRNLQEVNVFNNKLVYTNKLLQGASLNDRQKVAVIEAFDRAETLREVQLTYKNISEALKITGTLSETKTKRPKSSRFLANSGTSRVLEESLQKESSESVMSERLQKLAGLVD